MMERGLSYRAAKRRPDKIVICSRCNERHIVSRTRALEIRIAVLDGDAFTRYFLSLCKYCMLLEECGA